MPLIVRDLLAAQMESQCLILEAIFVRLLIQVIQKPFLERAQIQSKQKPRPNNLAKARFTHLIVEMSPQDVKR